MEPIIPITLRIPDIPAVERVVKRTDPDQQKREQQRREHKKREPQEPESPELPPEDDGLPHIDISV
jgi:hypothetical protein